MGIDSSTSASDPPSVLPNSANSSAAPSGAGDHAAKIAAMIDHTLLKATATEEQIRQLCAEAIEFRFASVCVNPVWVPLCAELLTRSPVRVCTVIGFPLGATLSAVKAFEAEQCIADGAQELDMVISIGALKAGQFRVVQEDIAGVVKVAHSLKATVKVIIETAYLSAEEKVEACRLAKTAGADYVKTSTGFGPAGATAADIALMREAVGPDMGIKAAGGIKTAGDLLAMIAAGATRIGTSSGVEIISALRG